MNIENAKIAIDKMVAFLPEYILNDLYKDHSATAHNISKDDSKVVFSVTFNDGEKRILTVTVKRNVGADDARLHRHEINVHYNGTMQVFSQLITAEFYSDIVNVLFPEDAIVSEKTGSVMKQLKDHVQYAIKGALKGDGKHYVLIEHEGKTYTRLIKYKPFSNFPIEYINWNNSQYQVNTIKELY